MQFFVDLDLKFIQVLPLRLHFSHFLLVIIQDIIIKCLKLTLLLLDNFP